MKAALHSWLARAIKHPQQLWLRKALFQVHLWSGLLLALYVMAISITGSILVFKDELQPRPHLANSAFDAKRCTPQSLLQAMDAAARSHAVMTPSLASCPTEADPFYAITLHPLAPASSGPRSLVVYVHPDTGQVVGTMEEAASWIGVVDDLHINLLLRRNGRIWNGAGAGVLLLLAVTGVPLWWPGIKNWRRALKVNPRLSWKRINFDLHSAAGFWTLFFTLAWAVTGIYFAWPVPFEKAILSVSPIRTAIYPEQELNRISQRPPSPPAGPLNVKALLDDAVQRSPGENLEGFFFGTGPGAVLTVYMARGHLGDYTRTTFLYFDQQTGQHLYSWRRGVNQTLGDWLLWLFVPLHFGTSWGLPGKTLWCALGLVLPVLAVSGVLMYWNRFLRKRFNG